MFAEGRLGWPKVVGWGEITVLAETRAKQNWNRGRRGETDKKAA